MSGHEHKRNNDINKLFPVRTDESGKKLCRKCGKDLPKGRRAWCSDECSTEALIVCYPSFARHYVERRDKGVCACCGRDTERLKRRVYRIYSWLKAYGRYRDAEKWLRTCREHGWPVSPYHIYSRSWWDADHIVPVVEGGGGCGLDNYRTLCVPCHKKETKALAGRLAEARRNQVQPALPGVAA